MIFDLDHPFMLLYRTSSSPSGSRLFHPPTSPLGCVLPPVVLPQEHPRLVLYLRLHFFVRDCVVKTDFGLRS
jgi:hypothetical protein